MEQYSQQVDSSENNSAWQYSQLLMQALQQQQSALSFQENGAKAEEARANIAEMLAQFESMAISAKEPCFQSYSVDSSTAHSSFISQNVVDDIDESMEVAQTLNKEEYMQKLMMEQYLQTILKSNSLNASYYQNLMLQKAFHDQQQKKRSMDID